MTTERAVINFNMNSLESTIKDLLCVPNAIVHRTVSSEIILRFDKDINRTELENRILNFILKRKGFEKQVNGLQK